MRVHGQCHCGGIAYEADVDPADVSACHCTDCQTLSGSPYRVSVRAPAATFALLRGTPSTYVKTAESGARRVHAFCPDCGAPVYSAAIENPPAYSLRVGCLRERAQLPPRRQIWCRSAVPWSSDLRGISAVERQ
jgi:hypothetical protein